jgi:hypothetical protein
MTLRAKGDHTFGPEMRLYFVRRIKVMEFQERLAANGASELDLFAK